jgi:acyl-CoA reductase-like NAD-dependent aldehyde dehydrogenase
MKEIKLFINGEFKKSEEDFTFVSHNPANGESVAQVHLPTNKDIDYAVESAEKAFYSQAWRGMDKNQRADLLLAVSEKIKERKAELIELEIKDSGSTIRKAKADVANASSYFKVLRKKLREY